MNRFPRGAKSSKLCTLDMLKTDGSVPQVSLFKHKRVKGWWPFHVKNEGEEMELTVAFTSHVDTIRYDTIRNIVMSKVNSWHMNLTEEEFVN